MKYLKSSLLKNSIIYTVTDAINKSVPFLILPVLSYYLTPKDYGIITNYNVILSIIILLVPLGANFILPTIFYKLSKLEFSHYVGNVFFVGLLTAAVLLIIVLLGHSLLLKQFDFSLQLQLGIVVMGLSTLFTTVHLSILRLQEKATFFGIYGILQSGVNIGLSLLLVVVLHRNWEGRVEGIFYSTILFGIYSLYYLYKNKYVSIVISKKIIIECILFGLPLIPHVLSFWLRSSADRLIISSLIGDAETGLYATGFQFGLLVSFLTVSFNNAFSPHIYKSLSVSESDLLEQNKAKLVKITYWVMLALGVISLFFVVFSNLFLDYIISPKYAGAKKYIPYALISQLFQGFYLLFVNYIFVVKKTKALAVITIGCSFLQVLFTYGFVVAFGAIGAAYSNVLISFLIFILVLRLSQKVYPMNWFGFKSQ